MHENRPPYVLSQSIDLVHDPLALLRRTDLAAAAPAGSGLLNGLASLAPGEIPAYAAQNASALTKLVANPPAPRLVTGWWDMLPTSSQVALTSAVPEMVGNLNGIPYSFRNLANRTFLGQTMDGLKTQLETGVGRSQATEAQTRLAALTEIEEALGEGDARPGRELVSLSVSGEPTAAIALGDLDEADYVSYLVPGMFFGVQAQIGEWSDIAARLYTEQVSWQQLLSEADATTADPATTADVAEHTEPTVATVAWIGYQTPHLLNVGSLDLAYQGRDALTSTIEGLKATRSGDQPYVSILAHSYGSTAALMALTEKDFMVDALALIGSPGSPAKSVDELHVRNANVFVGEAGWDPITNTSFFGSDPGAASYGAKDMSVSGGTDVITNDTLLPSTGHNEYFAEGTESLRNLALIAIDQGALVTDGTTRDQARTLALAR
ncbi:MAG: alpha/beta hydrolase [Microbacteriaceae bacterium]